ncbi:hypothetical protein ACFFKU_04225 [Kineococcus gynurae]|uniref:Uncharacterized protein n=1 Tax=Kineococcus gynurae TaxID=452979 RepID=A0ABV5LRJ9_9ACTN
MAIPIGISHGDSSPLGHSYAAVLVRVEDGAPDRGPVLDRLRALRFTGWVTGPHEGWLVVVCGSPGTVATGRRGVLGVGEALAAGTGSSALALLVRNDRQLLLVGWDHGREVGRYLSDPSFGLGRDTDVLSDSIGVEHAEEFAALAGRPGAADDLAELLAEEIDADETIESERLDGIAGLLGLPRWLPSVSALPRELPVGPARGEFVRLGGGRTGPLAGPWGTLLDVVRKRRHPPAAVTDPPRGSGPGEFEAWML